MSQPSTLSDYSSYFRTSGFKAAFSLRSFSVRRTSLREAVAHAVELDPSKLVIPEQVHSNRVTIVSRPGSYAMTDGVLTNNPQLVLTIQVADCIPMFILDPVTPCFGLVHAGWRGVAEGIGHQTIERLRDLAAPLDQVRFLLGPSIRLCCFEVGEEVATQFPRQYIKREKGQRPHVSLQAALIAQLRQHGVRENQLKDVQKCTYCNSEEYFSYRREGTRAGRMIGIVGWK
ncbi:MAG: peptidoglycan editing factor PgeF [Fidelibacterota bacterium]